MDTYRSKADGDADRGQQQQLLTALNAWERALRRDECGAWTISGRHGSIHTWGDGKRWVAYANPQSTVDPDGSPRAWNSAKRTLAFLTVTQDGDVDGCFHIEQLPTPEEATLIRETLGIRKRMEVSPETIERLARTGFRPAAN